MKISVVILTQNEEQNIARCLSSILWSDDILLIDNSSDQTISIAQKLVPPKSLRIIRNNQTDDFSRLRNEALGKVKHDWVLFLDADEEVSEELSKELQLATEFGKYDGFLLYRKDFFLGRWLKYGETKDISLLKFGKKSAGKWHRAVHEVWEIPGSIGTITAPLLHYPHPTIAEFLGHINRWTTLDAQVFFEANVRANFFKIIAYPLGKFFRNYFWKLGFLDGMPGLIMGLMMSFHSFLTRAKLYQLQKQERL